MGIHLLKGQSPTKPMDRRLCPECGKPNNKQSSIFRLMKLYMIFKKKCIYTPSSGIMFHTFPSWLVDGMVDSIGFTIVLIISSPILLVGGIPTPLKNMSSSVGSWIWNSQYKESHKIKFQTTKQYKYPFIASNNQQWQCKKSLAFTSYLFEANDCGKIIPFNL